MTDSLDKLYFAYIAELGPDKGTEKELCGKIEEIAEKYVHDKKDSIELSDLINTLREISTEKAYKAGYMDARSHLGRESAQKSVIDKMHDVYCENVKCTGKEQKLGIQVEEMIDRCVIDNEKAKELSLLVAEYERFVEKRCFAAGLKFGAKMMQEILG